MPSTQKSPHYGALLVVLLILIVVAPMIGDGAGYGVELFLDLVLIVGAHSAAWRSRHRYPFLALTVVTLGMRSGLPVGSSAADVGSALLYFSIVSITTMGYGDILPVSELARSVAGLEGVFGTLYLAVMIARLVGLHGQSEDAA
jgi:hypothetical protein